MLDVAGNARSNAWIGRANGSAPTADAAIYRAADNTLGFSTANTERARITSGGNFGIGTTTVSNLLQVAGAIGLDNSVMRSSATGGDFSITVSGLATLTGSAWRDCAMLVFYQGLDGDLTDRVSLLTFIRLTGLSTYDATVVSNIVGTATITTSGVSSTGVTVAFDVPNDNFGSVFVLVLGGNEGARPTVSIAG